MSTSEVTIERPIKPDYTAKVFMERRAQSLPIDFPDRRQVRRVAFNSCDVCDKDFPGPTGASDYVNHVCIPKVARESLKRELESTLARKEKVEDELRRAFDKAVDQLGFVRAIESLARECEGIAERDSANSDCWMERSVTLHEAAQVGEEQL